MIPRDQLIVGQKVWYVPPFTHADALQSPFLVVVTEVPPFQGHPYRVAVRDESGVRLDDLFLTHSEAIEEHVAKCLSMIKVKQHEIVKLQTTMEHFMFKIRDCALAESRDPKSDGGGKA